MKVYGVPSPVRYEGLASNDMPRAAAALIPAAVHFFAKRESTISKVAKTPRIAHKAQRLELLSRIQQRHEGLAAKHEALKLQASRNFDATRAQSYLQSAKEHHAAMLGHRSLANHARKEWIWLHARGTR